MLCNTDGRASMHNEKIISLILVMQCFHPFILHSSDSSSACFISLPPPPFSYANNLYVPFHYIPKPSLWSSSFSPSWQLSPQHPLSIKSIFPPLPMSRPSQLSAQSLFLYISKPLDLTCLSDLLLPHPVHPGHSL